MLFAYRFAEGHVRESTSPHSSPTFCVRKAIRGWRIVHAFNKLNAATVPAQTLTSAKVVILYGMSNRIIYPSTDLIYDFYQIIIRERDIPYKAVSIPSGMLWEWLVMPQALSNTPAIFNRCVKDLINRCKNTHRVMLLAYSSISGQWVERTYVDIHRKHVCQVLYRMRKHKLYADIKNCIFTASETTTSSVYCR